MGRAALLGLAAAWSVAAAARVALPEVLPASASLPQPAAAEDVLLSVTLNQLPQQDAARVLRLPGQQVALLCSDWALLRLAPPMLPADLWHAGQCWRPLSAGRGLRWHIDDEAQALEITAGTAAFEGSVLTVEPVATAAQAPTRWGGYANYDLQWQRSTLGQGGGRTDATRALLELGSFGPAGSGRTTGLARDDGQQPRFVRLDTTWTQDMPQRMASLRLGDAVGRAGAWGQAMRFAGVQWATDFSIQPGFLSFPLPALRGETALPSTVDVFVNGSRRLSSQVPAGPFELQDLPVVTGQGDVRLVVRDLLGREQVIVQRYFGSQALLRPGLRSFSYELGAVRKDYGLQSNRYGPLYAGATERQGVSDRHTREWRAEWLDGRLAAGGTGLWQLGPGGGIGSLSVVGSHAPREGAGAQLGLGLDLQGQRMSGGLQAHVASRRFSQAGQGPEGPQRTQVTASAGGLLGAMSWGLSWVSQQAWQGEGRRLLSLSLSRTMGAWANLGLFGVRDLAGGGTSLLLSVSMLLDGQWQAAAQTSRLPGRAGAATQLQLHRSPVDDRDLGWHLVADQGDARRLTLQAAQATDVADFSAGVSHRLARRGGAGPAAASTDWRLGVAGGLAWMDDSLFFSRRIDGAFALVVVDDYPDVTVLHDQRPVARTDARGRAVVPGLRGYEPNRIGIDASELPFDADVDALDTVVTPPARSGVVVHIPVRRTRSAHFRLVDAQGQPVPAGSVMETVDTGGRFPVGFEGRTYASGLAATTAVRVRWQGRECHAVLTLAAQADEAPDLGTVTCE